MNQQWQALHHLKNTALSMRLGPKNTYMRMSLN